VPVHQSELDFLYSNVVITVSRDYHKRAPETLEAFVRAYLEGSRGGARAEGQGAQGDSKIHPAQRAKTNRRAL
jgi:hypothetical protein